MRAFLTSNSAQVRAPSLTVPSCTMVVGAFGILSLPTFSPPSGMTERADLSNGSGANITLETADRIMEGVTGDQTATATSATTNIGQLFALAPL